jgi:hypothetical protein
MSKTVQEYRLDHAPTLNTVLMVEHTLQTMNESIITVAHLKKILPKQINHNTLMTILTYLEASNKIAVSLKGITWIHHTNPRLRKAISEGLEL